MLERLSSCSEILPNKVDRRCSGSSPLTVGTRLLAVGVVAVFLTSAQVWCLNIGPKQQTASQPDRSGVREQRPASEQSTQLAQHLSQGESHGNAWIIHTDLGVFVATLLLAGFTFVHVRHFRRLVERIERIYELQSTPRIVASLIDDEGHVPRIRVQNIGQVPLVVVGLRFQLLQFGSMIEDPPSQDVSEIRYSWMVPGETRMIDRPLLRRLWTDGSARSVTIECSYLVPQFCDPWSKVGRYNFPGFRSCAALGSPHSRMPS